MTLSDLIASCATARSSSPGPRRDLRQAARPLRRRVRRQAEDEPPRRGARVGATAVSLRRPGHADRARPAAEIGLGDGTGPTSRSASAPRTSSSHPTAGRRTGRHFRPRSGCMEPIGSDTFVELDVGAATIVARVDPDLPIAPGQPVVCDATVGRDPSLREGVRRAHRRLIAIRGRAASAQAGRQTNRTGRTRMTIWSPL